MCLSAMQSLPVAVFGTCLVLLISNATGLTLTPCSGGINELDLTTYFGGRITFNCSGATSRSDVIVWVYKDTDNKTKSIRCGTSGTCSKDLVFFARRDAYAIYSELRTYQYYESVVTQNVTALWCRTRRENVSPTCQFDVVYPAEGISCSARFNTVGSRWTVSGQCDVSRVLSRNGRYECLWTESSSGQLSHPDEEAEGSGEERLPADDSDDWSQNQEDTALQREQNATQISPANTTLTTKLRRDSDINGVHVRSMTCTFSKAFPTTAGTYNYSVVISPGSASPAVEFDGFSTITLPSATTTCPTGAVKAGDSVDCTCNSSGGSPAGLAVWRGTNSARLTLSNVVSGDHGNQYHCDIMWGSVVAGTSTFTLKIAAEESTTQLIGWKAVAMAVGLTLAVVMVIVVVVVVWLWRRKWILPCAVSEGTGAPRRQDVELLQHSPEPDYDDCGEVIHDDTPQKAPEPVCSEPNLEPNKYERLDTQDVGIRSVYTGLANGPQSTYDDGNGAYYERMENTDNPYV